ncbi:ABC transporter ATP-binding protein [Microlunatus speluncae]|uniref:ABC transporter ATP-binding protein n=1 Tax=Microlunatus speluncae TaxID=2594267 RepID=UPI0012661FD8|nr:ABC transporter ATP-binding protein [Microlunatus speluncae]
MSGSPVLLELDQLKTHFHVDGGVVRAVDGVSLTVPAGKTVCVVGESGCGKSITARSVLQLIERPGRIVDGRILWLSDGAGGERIDLAALDPEGEPLRKIRGGEIAMVFQEPMASLSPMYTVGNQLVEAIRVHLSLTEAEAWQRGLELLGHVGIPRPQRTMESYPFQLSGGMCQRVMIAIALSCRPRLLIADEPTTALDVTTQARIIDLLADLQAETSMAMIFITHDLGVVAEIADEVVVMYLGTVVEQGPVDEIFHNPQHPYTRALLASIPRMGRGAKQRLATIPGQVPHPLRRPRGCPFHTRCTEAIPGLCNVQDPPMIELGERRRACCVLHDQELLDRHRSAADAVEVRP